MKDKKLHCSDCAYFDCNSYAQFCSLHHVKRDEDSSACRYFRDVKVRVKCYSILKAMICLRGRSYYEKRMTELSSWLDEQEREFSLFESSIICERQWDLHGREYEAFCKARPIIKRRIDWYRRKMNEI